MASDGANLEQQQPLRIVFFDVETTIPFRAGQKHELLEFACVVLDAQGLFEIESYNTLIQPKDLKNVTRQSFECNGIAKPEVARAPSFADVSDDIFQLLDGKIWAGHNIQNFDIPRIIEAFKEISCAAPSNIGVIDTYPLLRKTFGKRAGNYKLASLAKYFGYGEQEHRSLADIRLNMEVLKSCATILLLEKNYPHIFIAGSPIQTSMPSRIQSVMTSPSYSPGQTSMSPLDSMLESSVEYFPTMDSLDSKNERYNVLNSGQKAASSAETVHAVTPQAVSSCNQKDHNSPCIFHISVSPARELDKDTFTDIEENITSTPSNYKFTKYNPSAAQAVVESLEEWAKVISDTTTFEDEDGHGHGHVISEVVSMSGITKEAQVGDKVDSANVQVVSFLGTTESALSGDKMRSAKFDVAEDYDVLEGLSSLSLSHEDEKVVSRCSIQDLIIDLACASFLPANSISLPLVELRNVGGSTMLIYNGFPLQIVECGIKMRFTVNPTYAFDDKGKPRFSILVEPSESALHVVNGCEELARKELLSSLSLSEEMTWFSPLIHRGRVHGARMSIGTKGYGSLATYTTKFYKNKENGLDEITLGQADVSTFTSLLPHGSIIDVGFGIDIYSFEKRAGVRLLAKHITIPCLKSST